MGIFLSNFFMLIWLLAIIVGIGSLIGYIYSIVKHNNIRRHKCRNIFLVSLVLFIIGPFAVQKAYTSDNTVSSRRTTKTKKKTSKKLVSKQNTKTKNKPLKPKRKPLSKAAKAKKNGKAYENELNNSQAALSQYCKYDYKKNVLTWVGYDDMLNWKHSEFKKGLAMLEALSLRKATKYHIYIGSLKIRLVSENKTPIAHWTNEGDWQFDR